MLCHGSVWLQWSLVNVQDCSQGGARPGCAGTALPPAGPGHALCLAPLPAAGCSGCFQGSGTVIAHAPPGTQKPWPAVLCVPGMARPQVSSTPSCPTLPLCPPFWHPGASFWQRSLGLGPGPDSPCVSLPMQVIALVIASQTIMTEKSRRGGQGWRGQ